MGLLFSLTLSSPQQNSRSESLPIGQTLTRLAGECLSKVYHPCKTSDQGAALHLNLFPVYTLVQMISAMLEAKALLPVFFLFVLLA